MQAVVFVLEHSDAEGGERLVLISIANHADRTGDNAFPSYSTIAHESRMTRRNVITCVKALERSGEIEVRREKVMGRLPRNVYRLVGMTGEKSSPLLKPTGETTSEIQRAKLVKSDAHIEQKTEQLERVDQIEKAKELRRLAEKLAASKDVNR